MPPTLPPPPLPPASPSASCQCSSFLQLSAEPSSSLHLAHPKAARVPPATRLLQPPSNLRPEWDCGITQGTPPGRHQASLTSAPEPHEAGVCFSSHFLLPLPTHGAPATWASWHPCLCTTVPWPVSIHISQMASVQASSLTAPPQASSPPFPCFLADVCLWGYCCIVLYDVVVYSLYYRLLPFVSCVPAFPTRTQAPFADQTLVRGFPHALSGSK